MHFGGAANGDLLERLTLLLQERGVAKDAIQERANLILDKLGRQPVGRAFRLTDPWRELKHLANQQIPKLQLVLPSELQTVIQLRAQQDKPIGSKHKKVKHPKGDKKPLQLGADDVSIPDGIFMDSAKRGLSQIPFGSIGATASGIAIVSASQAVPYLRIVQPISQRALALIVVDSQAPILHGIGEEVRFPAKCEHTGEAIILTAKILQLGSDQVRRASRDAQAKVDEVANQVIRTVSYRDELTHIEWKNFIAKPVKHVIAEVPCLQPTEAQSPIIDVWDRQYLNDRLEKVKPTEATLFSACFRLERPDISQDLANSGQRGHYLEPRTQDGRAPDTAFRVVWLNKSDKQGATIASQSTTEWNCIVRSGNRFGLRVRAADAEVVHRQHKPATPYLDGEKLLMFHAGPFPHGSNRAALCKLFQQWGWAARPCQPRSRAPTGLGIIWEVQATCPPPFEVYQLQHADVLISAIAKKPPKTNMPDRIQGSAKTLAAIASTQAHEDKDPWEADDPWSNYQTPVKAAKKEPVRPDQLDAIAAKVAQRLQPSQKAAQYPMDDGDTAMADDERIEGLEKRLQVMEDTLREQQTRKEEQHADVNLQIGQLKQHVDHQSTSMQQLINTRMTEQLTHIEKLLTANQEPAKKTRLE